MGTVMVVGSTVRFVEPLVWGLDYPESGCSLFGMYFRTPYKLLCVI
jgi:hypothetical protein